MLEESKLGKREREPMAVTMTGEAYQPARLYYQIGQKEALLGRLNGLRCIDYDAISERWVWLYKGEAKNIKLGQSAGEIPQEYGPIIFGYLKVKRERELLVDVSSLPRVIEAIMFFDQKINHRLAKLEKVRIVNKLCTEKEKRAGMARHPTQYFEETEAVNVQEKIEELEKRAEEEREEGEKERREEAVSELEKELRQKLPLVEELKTDVDEEGIERLQMLLEMREVEAREHWQGNQNFSRWEIWQEMLEEMEEDGD